MVVVSNLLRVRLMRQKLFGYALVILLILAVPATSALLLGWRDLNRPLTLQPETFVVLAPGQNLGHILEALKERHWFVASWRLRAVALVKGYANYLQAGEYLVTGRSALDLLDAMAQGSVHQRFFVLLPGWRWSELRSALERTSGLVHHLAQIENPDLITDLGLSLPFLEGAFYPDTYAYTIGTKDTTLLLRAHQMMLTVLEDLWSARDVGLPLANPGEALILASIIEKETGLDSDRPMIASVLVNRLRLNMKLETDPTVIFGLGSQFDGNLTRRHLRSPSTYNTYMNEGLPPTPIALPGRSSITAALRPEVSKALFFVARGDGSSQFSETLQAHKKAVRRYQLNRRKK